MGTHLQSIFYLFQFENKFIYSRELNDFVLPIGIKHVPDILVFGTQESCSERFEWEVCLQETLGPSHILYHSVSLGKSSSFIRV